MVSCIEAARHNGRSVRTALTTEMWDALNGAYLELAGIEREARTDALLPKLCDWTKRQGALLRGTTETLAPAERRLRLPEPRLLPRARRQHGAAARREVLRPAAHHRDGRGQRRHLPVDDAAAVAARRYRAFHWAYGGEYTPRKIAHFLILNRACPRSLTHCADQADFHLSRLRRGLRRGDAGPRPGARDPGRAVASPRSRTSSARGCTSSSAASSTATRRSPSDVADGYLFGPQ